MERRSLGPMAQGVALARCQYCGRSYDARQCTLEPNGRYACPLPDCVAKRNAPPQVNTWQEPATPERPDDV